MRTTDVTGTCQLPEGTKMVMPGDNITMTIELITPVGLEEQMRFAIREGGTHRRRRHRHQGPRVDELDARLEHRMSERIDVTLACSECEARNYQTTRKPDAAGAARAQEILSHVQAAHGPQRNEVAASYEESRNAAV